MKCEVPAQAGAPDTSIFCDWNATERRPARRPQIVDETLRDGLQSPSARDPSVADKLELLAWMARVGADCAALGYPAARQRQYADALTLARQLPLLAIRGCCAARALERDIRPIAEISQTAGVRLQVGLFVGASRLRQRVEGWTLEALLRLSDEAVGFAVRENLDVLYVVEDGTRSTPEDLTQLYRTAVRAGASQICIADTAGHATPAGARAIVEFTRRVLDGCDSRIGIDWHGHRDRGLAVANSLAAWNAGAERCHGTALGLGERCGNTPIELLLVNRALMGFGKDGLRELQGYVSAAALALGVEIPPQQPVVGRDAFSTATGTHAAAALKAREAALPELAELLYSSIPASWLGREPSIEVGPLSGEANVQAWLRTHDLPATPRLVKTILEHAKRCNRILRSDELDQLARDS